MSIKYKQVYESCDLKGTKKYKKYKEGLDNMKEIEKEMVELEKEIVELAMKVASSFTRENLESFLLGYCIDYLQVVPTDAVLQLCSSVAKDFTSK